MLCTQLEGLSKKAIKFLEENCQKTYEHTCPHCNEGFGNLVLDKKVYDKETGRRAGMFDDGPDLFEYKLINGDTIKEVVQEVVWSSGPCIFLCLEDSNGKLKFKWPEKNLNNC